ncbi:hypothetical protein [Flavobacterium sp.]|jgi:hypothetical protein|uniref:hypothetical protein n=1 Tax=Flavobacterium sp. TaxID=239 RepID=UPI0037C0DE0C
MALNRIEKLIESYLEGETSVAEENELKVYFSSTDVAQHLKHYQPLFSYFTQAKEEQFSREILLPTKKENNVQMWSIAASVVVLLGVGTFMYVQNTKADDFVACSPEDSPELALEQTQKALALVSEHLNTGIKSVSYINEYEESKDRIFK